MLLHSFAAMILSFSTGGAATDRVPTIEDAAFMVGHWRAGGNGGPAFEEVWLPASGGMVSGHMRMGPPDGDPSLYELLSITESDDGLVMRISHFSSDHTPWKVEVEGGPVVLVATTASDANALTFTDTTAQGRVDSIGYRLRDDGSLESVIMFPLPPGADPSAPRRPLVITFTQVSKLAGE